MEFYVNRGVFVAGWKLSCVFIYKNLILRLLLVLIFRGRVKEAGKKIEKGLSWEMNLTSNWEKCKLIPAT